jgi:Uma2 family endonuclease
MAATSEIVLGPPPMEAGDRLTREEFERRWKLMPHVNKAELIEGVVYMPTAVRYQGHGRPHTILNHWLHSYELATPGVEAADNTSLRLDNDNEPQPDLLLRLEHSLGGQSWEDDEGYLAGAPELVVEIAASSASYDLHQKLHGYRRHGVREYVVWRVFDKAIDWFVLHEGNYQPLVPDVGGLLKSLVFPGLWLDVPALLRNDLAAAAAAANLGLASPEHAEFIAQLREKRGGQ